MTGGGLFIYDYKRGECGMAGKRSGKTSSKRLIPFLAVLVASCLIAATTTFSYQIVQGQEYQKLARQNNQTTETVAAARGQITDRYGRVLVTNKLSLNIEIGSEFPQPAAGDSDEEKDAKNAQGNQVIINLIRLFSEHQAAWVDDFPISSSPPYSFLPGKEEQASKLKSVLGQQDYATAEDSLNLLIDEFHITGYDETETRQIAGVRGQMLMNDYSQTNPYVFAEDVDPTFASELMELRGDELLGVQIAETSTRYYPAGDIAPHLLGTVGPIYAEDYDQYKDQGYAMDAIVGKSGIESAMESQLRGKDGKLTVVRDDDGKVVDEYYAPGEEPQPGNTVVLSIDAQLQKQLQEALASYVKANPGPAGRAKGAGLSVIDVKTGETLALVSYPGYNINDYNTNYDQLAADSLNPLLNRALMGVYRPGSSFKTFMATAGLLSGTITESTTYNCVNPFMNTEMTCLQLHHSGPTNIYTALQRSCNIYFYSVARDMGIDLIDEYAPYFGYATDTGLEITNSDGRVTNPQYYEDHGVNYQVGYTYQTGIGQAEVYVTPLQMSICMMTIANHGTRYAAHVIKSVEKYDYSGTVYETQPEVLSQLPADNSAYDVVMKGMTMMAQTLSPLQGVDIATKSGSPQYTDSNTKLTNAAAVGIYPASSPEIGLGLLIEDGANAPNFFAQLVSIYENCKAQETEAPASPNQLIAP